MTDGTLDAIRDAFARLTALIEDATTAASVGQGIDSIEDARRQLQLLSKALDCIGRRLRNLEKRLG